jgi:hypothetical protein
MYFLLAISGYFIVDRDSTLEKPVFNSTVTLKKTIARVRSIFMPLEPGFFLNFG